MGQNTSEPFKEELIALIAALKAENTSLKARIAELERRLGLNSSNSGKPPSSGQTSRRACRRPTRLRAARLRASSQPASWPTTAGSV